MRLFRVHAVIMDGYPLLLEDIKCEELEPDRETPSFYFCKSVTFSGKIPKKSIGNLIGTSMCTLFVFEQSPCDAILHFTKQVCELKNTEIVGATKSIQHKKDCINCLNIIEEELYNAKGY